MFFIFIVQFNKQMLYSNFNCHYFVRFINFTFILQFSHGVLQPSVTGYLSLVKYV